MVFSDQAFLFFFLPIALLTGLLLRRTPYYMAVIFIFSMIFYSWSAGLQVLLLIFSAVFNYCSGILINRYHGRWTLFAAVFVNFALLAYFKYAYFIVSTIDPAIALDVTKFLKSIVLPIGISFFTFQAISYLIDVYRREIGPERDFLTFAAYLSFFPQLIAGPVVRFITVRSDLHAPLPFQDSFAPGVRRFAHGLIKKLLIADTVAAIADAAFSLPAHEVTSTSALIGAWAYTLQIYFDFSGYSDMAIGLGLMYGVRFDENFMHPYSSRSITEFWRRWHISLSSWFRDYLYIPLGGNRTGALATYRNLILTFIATGVWHGAAWSFVIWGLYHGAFLIVERLIWGKHASQIRTRAAHYLYCLPVVMVGWIIFRADTLGQSLTFIKALLWPFNAQAGHIPPLLAATLSPQALLTMAIGSLIIFLPADITIGRLVQQQPERASTAVLQICYLIVCLTVAFVLSVSSNFSPFLYFRF